MLSPASRAHKPPAIAGSQSARYRGLASPDIVSGVAGHSLTLIDLLEWRARTQPERVAYTYLVDGEAITNRLTWGELHQRARIIARQLTALGATGKTVLLLY